MKILLVEDTVTLRYTMSAYIKRAGHEALLAESGEQALQIIENTAVDLVIMDVEMPGLNGFETTRLMRESFGNHWVPIIFVTGMTDDDSFREGIDAGGDDYLTKPVSPIILKAKIRAFERITEMQNELKRLNRELRAMSQRDELTGLYNRRAFEDMAEKQWRTQRRQQAASALLMIDIDYFKDYNDHYGHQAGDHCLQQVAVALQSALTRPADIIARYGGEEFIAFLPDTDDEGAATVAESLRAAVEDLRVKHPLETVGLVTISLGAAISQDSSGISLYKLTEQADRALYHAKQQGRNRVVMESVVPDKTVLVVDHRPDTVRVLDKALRGRCTVLRSYNNEECLEVAHNIHPDVIVMDTDSLGEQTLALCQQLKGHQQTQAIPIICLSDESMPSAAAKLKLAGWLDKRTLADTTLVAQVQKHL